MKKLSLLSSFVLLLLLGVTLAVKEPRTGIAFPEKFKGSGLSKLGVRTKGPIKVYAVGQYGDETFLLKMSHGVGADKMSAALADALKPRCSDSSSVSEFESLLKSGLPNGAKKGTNLAFGTRGGKLSLEVNGEKIGSISSKPLAAAFARIYNDKNAVCKMKPVSEEL